MDRVPFSIEEGRRLLINTATGIGYPTSLAEQLVDAALWVERRDSSGLSALVLYLVLSRDQSHEERKPTIDDRGRLRCVCPIMSANVFVNTFRKNGAPDDVVGLMGPASPELMAPILLDYAVSIGCALRLYAYRTTIRYCPNGCEFEGDTFGLYGLTDTETREPTGIEFIEPFELPAPPPLTTLRLPRLRITGGDRLRLDDPPRDAR